MRCPVIVYYVITVKLTGYPLFIVLISLVKTGITSFIMK